MHAGPVSDESGFDRCVAFDLDGCLWHPAMAKLRGEGPWPSPQNV